MSLAEGILKSTNKDGDDKHSQMIKVDTLHLLGRYCKHKTGTMETSFEHRSKICKTMT